MEPRAILVVDDETSITELVGRALRKKGHQVTTVSDGEQATRMVMRQRFDLVMTDLLMPDKDGIQVITEVRRKYPEIRLLAMSGGGHITQDQYLKIAKGLGAHAILEKPFTIEQLYEAVDKVLAMMPGAAVS